MPIPVVYTVGKVGSTAMTSAIRAAGLVCFDIHTLETDRINRLVNRKIDQNKLPERHLIESLAIHKMIKENPANFCFITAVREPLGQAISAFFQNLDLFIPNFDRRALPKADETIALFLEKYDLYTPIRWFETEMLAILSIDVLSERYSADDAVIEQGGVRILTLRVDWPTERKEVLIGEFVGKPIELKRENEAATKGYSELYQEFLDTIRFDPTVARKIYDSRFCRRFWTPEEREALYSRWTAQAPIANAGATA